MSIGEKIAVARKTKGWSQENLAGLFMTVKILIQFFLSRETVIGKRRMQVSRNKSIFQMVWECREVYLSIIREKRMVLTLAIIAIYTLIITLNGNYWTLYITTKLGVLQRATCPSIPRSNPWCF